MSAAEPADSRRQSPDSGSADVIRMSEHRVGLQRKRPERATAAHQEPTAEQKLAETIQGLFNAHGRTLNDKATAETYGIALRAVLMVLDGALVEGVVGEEPHRHLRAMYEGMQRVPNSL